jgi:hypothetical protein
MVPRPVGQGRGGAHASVREGLKFGGESHVYWLGLHSDVSRNSEIAYSEVRRTRYEIKRAAAYAD